MHPTSRRRAGVIIPGLFLCAMLIAFGGPAAARGGTLMSGDEVQLDPNSIRYLGAFRLPPDGEGEERSFAYSGEALAYCGTGDNGKGSLYLTGHNWHTRVAEISIPAPSFSRDSEALPQAMLLQPFSSIRGTLFDRWGLEIPRVGLQVMGDRLFFCWGEHFEEPTGWGTHGVRSLDLSRPPSGTVCRINDNERVYATNDYLFEIPSRWADRYLPGYDLATGRFRDGGWSGMGPALFALRNADIINAGMDESVSAVPLILYDDSYSGDDGAKMTGYAHADSWSGGAWVDTPAGSAVLFAGTHGVGRTWYGFANGVEYPLGGNENEVYPEVPAPPYEQRGWWNDDFRPVLMFYSPMDLAAAATGELPVNQVQPCALLDLSSFMLHEKRDTDMQLLGDMTYDSTRGLMYLQELFADGDRPVIHVFRIAQ